MVRSNRVSRIITTVCLVCAPFTGTPLAAQSAVPTVPSASSEPSLGMPSSAVLPSRFTPKEPLSSMVALTPSVPALAAQRGWGWGRGHRGRHDGARAAMILGSVAAVAGTAVLVYANRPDCGAAHSASGCGYGTKVLGGAVLAGGVVTMTIGALTWR